uniref:AP2/ERF domain-containing protein n=1 Tax=Araucaria cunninghamii TaxID=56994 RepID=A0A0D6QR97_ARACU
MDNSGREEDTQTPGEAQGEKRPQYKGIRMRKWGKWVSEVRMPKSREKIWLGSYDTPEKAARAYDAAVVCLRGRHANLNFPNSIPEIPPGSSLSPPQIQRVAAKHAVSQIPSSSNTNENVSMAPAVSPSRSPSTSEMAASTDSQLVLDEQESALWQSLMGESEGDQCLDLENLPSVDTEAPLELITRSEEEEQCVFFDAMNLWSP